MSKKTVSIKKNQEMLHKITIKIVIFQASNAQKRICDQGFPQTTLLIS